MKITEYEDHTYIKYANITEYELEKHSKSVIADIQLVTGDRSNVYLTVLKQKNGKYLVVELIVDPSLDTREVDNIADLNWHYITTKQKNTKLLPIVDYWYDNENMVVATLNERYNDQLESITKQVKNSEDDEWQSLDREVCWWPDKTTWDELLESEATQEISPTKELKCQFYTFKEWFLQADNKSIDFEDRDTEYASYMNILRTKALFCKHKGIPMKVVKETEDMPKVYVEKLALCGVQGIIKAGDTRHAVISSISHLPEYSESMDCMGIIIYSGKVELAKLLVWSNPLYLEEFIKNGMEAWVKILDEYQVEYSKATVITKLSPFETCLGCGEMILLSVENLIKE